MLALTFWPPLFPLVTCELWPAAELQSVLLWRQSEHLACIQRVYHWWKDNEDIQDARINYISIQLQKPTLANHSRLPTFSSEHNGINFLYRFWWSKPDCKTNNYYKDLEATYRFLTSSITRWSYPTDRVLITFSFGPGIRHTPSIDHQMLIPFEIMSDWRMQSTHLPMGKIEQTCSIQNLCINLVREQTQESIYPLDPFEKLCSWQRLIRVPHWHLTPAWGKGCMQQAGGHRHVKSN